MWQSSEERSASDLASAMENLARNFRNLEIDAVHEAVYGLGKFYSEEECKEKEEKYRKAKLACNIYLQTANLEDFLHTMRELKLEGYLEEIKNFIPVNIYQKVFK